MVSFNKYYESIQNSDDFFFRLAEIFHIMESARSDPDLNLEDYSISQLTLDEVRFDPD